MSAPGGGLNRSVAELRPSGGMLRPCAKDMKEIRSTWPVTTCCSSWWMPRNAPRLHRVNDPALPHHRMTEPNRGNMDQIAHQQQRPFALDQAGRAPHGMSETGLRRDPRRQLDTAIIRVRQNLTRPEHSDPCASPARSAATANATGLTRNSMGTHATH